jgi:hypothetical protein
MIFSFTKNAAVIGGISCMNLLALLGALALLVGDAAAGLASGLARGLALTAATVLSAVAQVTGLDGLDMFHSFTFYEKILRC